MPDHGTYALELAVELRRRVVERLGRRLLEVRLFGSRARGDAHEESDVDVLVLVEELRPGERGELFELAAELGMETGLGVSALVMTRAEFARLRKAEARIALDIEREGITA